LRLIPLLLILLLAGCGPVPKASIEADQRAKLFESPPPNLGAIYVYRADPKSLWWGTRIAFIGGVTSELSTELPSGTFLKFESQPGLAEISCFTTGLRDRHEIVVVGGQVRYFETSISWGDYSPYCLVREVPAEWAQAAIRVRTRVEPQ
jgi:hypothetical protein